VRVLFYLTLLLIITNAAFSQKRKTIPALKPLSAKDILLSELADECLFINKYTVTQRLAFYPFDKAASVKLISFKEGKYIPVRHRLVNYNEVLEQELLTSSQIDSLTSLLYNVGFTPVNDLNIRLTGEANCYEPRNGILFLNTAGKVIEYIEICFACQRTKKSSKLIRDGEYCSTKFDLLKQFFLSTGIKYGTNERHPILSYSEIFKLDTVEAVFALQNKLAKKTRNGEDISQLNEVEKILYYTSNSNIIYRGSSELSGIAEFYFSRAGNYYTETIYHLNEIGALLTAGVLKSSLRQWNKTRPPINLAERRELLISHIDNFNSDWQKLEVKLFNYENENGDQVLINSENLDQIIINFANLHRNELKD
jgi:hypothetical protein